jgi:glucose-1-phosphate adenylyltransferase
MTHNVISVVLGGGKGTRLFPLTDQRSKPAVPIAGKYRLVDIPISNCLNSGYNRIYVLTQYNSASLNAHIKNTYNFSIFSKGFVDILAAEQTNEGAKWFQGTADAVRHLMRHLQYHDYDQILILSGDQLYQLDFQDMMENHLRSGADISIATIPVTAKDATGFGILKANPDGAITAFVEKPTKDLLPDWTSEVSEEMKAQNRHFLASMGIYIFNKGVLKNMLENHSGMDFGKELIPESIHTHKVQSYEYSGYWTDIGTIDSFFEANIGLTDDLPQFNLFDKNTIYTHARMLPPSKVSGTTLDRVVLADGCIIAAARIERSVIGVRARIGKGTVIRNTYMMGADHYQNLAQIEEANRAGVPLVGVGERCHIENAILDKSCCIGNDVRILGGKHLADGDYPTHSVQDGVVVVKKRAFLPNGTVIA